MKWKKYIESVNDAAEEPVIGIEVDEIRPESDGYGSLASNAQYLIDQYIGDQARKYYTNRRIPEDEEVEIRENLVPVYVKFEYWAPEDADYEAGYEDGDAMFIIDKTDGSLCNVDYFESVFPDEVYDIVEDAAYNYLGISKGMNCCPV